MTSRQRLTRFPFLCNLVMSATRLDLETTLFSDPGFNDKVSRFAMDSSTMVAYVTKERKTAVLSDGDEGTTLPQLKLKTYSPFSYPVLTSTSTLVYTLHLPPTPTVSSRLLSTLSLIKKRPTLDATTPIADQLHFVLLSSNSASASTANGNQDATNDQSQNGDSGEVAAPYEGLRSLVHFGVTPWFESYVNSKQGKTVEVSVMTGKKGADAQTGK